MELLVERDSRRDPDIPGLQEYGKNNETIRKVVRRFRDLPMHVVFTCLEQVVGDDNTGLPKSRPMLQGRMSSEVPAYMDIVGYLITRQDRGEDEVVKNTRVLITEPRDRNIGKDRLGSLGGAIENPSLADIVKKVESAAKAAA
jgi:hypothetical protein